MVIGKAYVCAGVTNSVLRISSTTFTLQSNNVLYNGANGIQGRESLQEELSEEEHSESAVIYPNSAREVLYK